MVATLGKFFIDTPSMALIPALVFLVSWFSRRDSMAAIAAFCWASYALLETLNKARITCSGECNIRIDLLMIYPGLILISVGAFIAIMIGAAIDSD